MSWHDLWPQTLANLIISAAGVEDQAIIGMVILFSLFVWLIGACLVSLVVCSPILAFGYFAYQLFNRGEK